MTLSQASPSVNLISARSNGIDYHLTVERTGWQVEVAVPERTYRRALIDYMSAEDIDDLHRWLDQRHQEVIALQEQEFGDWQPLPDDETLEDMADYHAGQARSNGFVLGSSAPDTRDRLAELAEGNGYETVEEYLNDAASDLFYIMLGHDYRISHEDARQNVIDSDGDVEHAAEMLLEDMDIDYDPRDERHFSPWFLNS